MRRRHGRELIESFRCHGELCIGSFARCRIVHKREKRPRGLDIFQNLTQLCRGEVDIDGHRGVIVRHLCRLFVSKVNKKRTCRALHRLPKSEKIRMCEKVGKHAPTGLRSGCPNRY